MRDAELRRKSRAYNLTSVKEWKVKLLFLTWQYLRIWKSAIVVRIFSSNNARTLILLKLSIYRQRNVYSTPRGYPGICGKFYREYRGGSHILCYNVKFNCPVELCIWSTNSTTNSSKNRSQKSIILSALFWSKEPRKKREYLYTKCALIKLFKCQCIFFKS